MKDAGAEGVSETGNEESRIMRRMPLMAQILVGFVAGTAIGICLSEFCQPETTKRILPFVAPFGAVLVAMRSKPSSSAI